MTRELIIHRAGPGLTIQDQGRPGYLANGLSRGGAADRLALAEGAALLGQDSNKPAIEMAGMGGEFEATEDMRIALTGAPMRANMDGERLAWNASHLLYQGARLTIGATETGSYGYLHLGGGIEDEIVLGAQSAHLAAGIKGPLKSGERIGVGADPLSSHVGMCLEPDERFEGGVLRILPSMQTEMFDATQRTRFETSTFTRDTRGNRMGVKLLPDSGGFQSDAGLSVISEVIVPGDVQITGDGTPFVLLSECQTTGGYPRIGSVIPADLSRIAQARAGSMLSFRFIELDEAITIERQEAERRRTLGNRATPLIRDPRTIRNLLAYQLISGVTAGDDLERSMT